MQDEPEDMLQSVLVKLQSFVQHNLIYALQQTMNEKFIKEKESIDGCKAGNTYKTIILILEGFLKANFATYFVRNRNTLHTFYITVLLSKCEERKNAGLM